VRVDAIGLSLTRGVAGASLELRPLRAVTAAVPVVLPAFDGWLPSAELVVELEGLAERPATLALELGGAPVGAPVRLAGSLDAGPEPFRARLVVPLRAVRAQLGAEQSLGLVCALDMPGATARRLTLTALTLAPLDGPGPELSHVELSDVTDALLVDAPERRLFDLQNPEEGFWRGSGKAHLALTLGWAGHEGPGYALELELARLSHALVSRGDESDALYEQRDRRRAEGGKTHAELTFDTGHEALEPVPDEGRDVPLDLVGEHVLGFELRAAEGKRAARALVTWRAALPLRLRDPRPLLKTFQRLSALWASTSARAPPWRRSTRRGTARCCSSAGPRGIASSCARRREPGHPAHRGSRAPLFAELSRVATRFPDLAPASCAAATRRWTAQAEAPRRRGRRAEDAARAGAHARSRAAAARSPAAARLLARRGARAGAHPLLRLPARPRHQPPGARRLPALRAHAPGQGGGAHQEAARRRDPRRHPGLAAHGHRGRPSCRSR
jgi:hypothetical protein